MRADIALALLFMLVLLTACTAPDKPTITLYLAVQRADLDQLERHIHWGADINAPLPNGLTPLQEAAQNGRIVMVRLLLKHGAEIGRETSAGETALDLAVLAGYTRTAEELLAAGAGLDPSMLLVKTAGAGTTNRDTVRFLVERGADTEARDDAGDTPLLIAIRQRNHRLVTHLLNQGADVNATAADGRSALTLARDLAEPELIGMLQRLGAR